MMFIVDIPVRMILFLYYGEKKARKRESNEETEKDMVAFCFFLFCIVLMHGLAAKEAIISAEEEISAERQQCNPAV